MSGVPSGQLRLRVVGGGRIDVAAVGRFDEACAGDVAHRLDRLVAGGPGCVHVDCSQVASIDPVVARLFAQANDRLRSIGGRLEFSDAPAELRSALSPRVRTPHGGAVQTRSAPAAS